MSFCPLLSKSPMGRKEYAAFIFCQKISVSIFNLFHYEQVKDIGRPQVKCRLLISTVIPRFTQSLWQPKNRVNRNLRYTSL